MFCACLMLLCFSTASGADAVNRLENQVGSGPALVVVVGNGDENHQSSINSLLDQTAWTVVCRGPGNGLGEIREWARTAGLLGQRISIIDDVGSSLWLADNMADAVWVLDGASSAPSKQEMLRVLRPRGIFVTSGNHMVKPERPRTDQWRHPYHGPDNNIVSHDRVAALPGELRFQTYPVFAAMPNQTLFAGGRMFFFTGHIAFHKREEPLLNRLTVLNAYNGLELWNRSLDPNSVVHNFTKVATDSEVIFAEGSKLLRLDAATGRQVGEHAVPREASAGTDTHWKWIAHQDGLLWAAFGPPDGRVAPHRQQRRMGHWPWNVANDQYRPIVENFGSAHTLAAFRYPEMELVWSVQEPEAFDVRALCMEGDRIFELAPGKYLAARDARTGEQLWRRTAETPNAALNAIGESLKRQAWGLGWATFCCARASDGVVCVAGPPFKKSVCIDLKDGSLLWSSQHESPHPFFLGDSLYLMPRVARPAAVCRRVDPRSGKVLQEYELGVIGSCTRLTATPDQFFYRPGGGEGRTVYFDISDGKLSPYEGVVRPGCFDGAVPAHGRLYWMPLACDCWQVHGTFSMAPRSQLPPVEEHPGAQTWNAPAVPSPATERDWPMFRADAAGTATAPVDVPLDAKVQWEQQLGTARLTAPICVGKRVFVGGVDGSVWGLDAVDGKKLWTAGSRAALQHPPAYWNGRIVFGSCDGFLYSVDAQDGRMLGELRVAPEKRFVNIMNQLMSAWPLGGGVVMDKEGIAYTAAGSTAADGAVVAAVDLSTGQCRWRHEYTLDSGDSALSFGVQSNVLLQEDRLLINGGAPVGIVAVDAESGTNPRVVAELDAGKEMFVEPDGRPFAAGPELFSNQWTRTTIFKRHQGRAYFEIDGRHIALVAGRLFCAREMNTLDSIVNKINTDPNTGQDRITTEPWDVMDVPLPDSLLWASETSDIRGMAVGNNGVIALHENSVEAFSTSGKSLWKIELPAVPVRWGVALADSKQLSGPICVVTLANGQVVGLGE